VRVPGAWREGKLQRLVWVRAAMGSFNHG